MLIIIYMTLLAAFAGGSLPGSQLLNKKGRLDSKGKDKGGISPVDLTWLPEMLFAVGIGYTFYNILGYFELCTHIKVVGTLLSVIWSYLWMQTGHANALSWGKNADPNRKNKLTPVVEFFYRKGFGRGYSATFFSVKGFLLTLPVGGLGALYWPLAYDLGTLLEEYGVPNKHAHPVSELLSGFFLGIHLYLVSLLI